MTSLEMQNEARQGLWFSIKIGEEEIVVFISVNALIDRFYASAKKSDQRAAYKKNKKIIDAVAYRKFHEGVPRPIKLTTADF